MSVAAQLSEALADLLREDERRVLLGEDIGEGGILGLSKDASEDEQLATRLLGLPLTSNAGIAHAGGLALAGMLPIVLLPSATALLEGLAALRELGKTAWSSGERRIAPILFIAPNGAGFGLGSDGAESVEATLAGVSGIRLLSLGAPEEARASLRAAAQFEGFSGPTVLLVPRTLAVADGCDQLESLGRPLGTSHRTREGAAATVFTWGETLTTATLAADHCGHDVSVVDIGALAPLDEDALVAAARETGKVVIAHAGPARQGVGAELAALFADRAIFHLDGPIVRVCGEPAPRTRADEWLAIPSANAIADAILRVVEP
jgi:pyruvate/2-oxoglutarate/acetoin dehydrogenase E1 component